MRLKSLTIGQYKNLKDFSLSFDGSSFIVVFVGKNGSGKSNLFEALIQIFRHLYESDKEKGDTGFDYIWFPDSALGARTYGIHRRVSNTLTFPLEPHSKLTERFSIQAIRQDDDATRQICPLRQHIQY